MKPTIGQLDAVMTALQNQAKEGRLPEFDFEKAWDIMGNKTQKQIRFINALLINKKYMKLKQVLSEWGLPPSEEYKNHLSEENLKINKHE